MASWVAHMLSPLSRPQLSVNCDLNVLKPSDCRDRSAESLLRWCIPTTIATMMITLAMDTGTAYAAGEVALCDRTARVLPDDGSEGGAVPLFREDETEEDMPMESSSAEEMLMTCCADIFRHLRLKMKLGEAEMLPESSSISRRNVNGLATAGTALRMNEAHELITSKEKRLRRHVQDDSV